jgi:hypothetical protein
MSGHAQIQSGRLPTVEGVVAEVRRLSAQHK